jgi:putative transposase
VNHSKAPPLAAGSFYLVWSPKYRKRVLEGAVGTRVSEMFREIADSNDITIEEMEVSPDDVHLFCSFLPRYSIAQIVTRFKSLPARDVFREFPQIKRQLWGGELWEDGYFARTVAFMSCCFDLRMNISFPLYCDFR